MGDREQHLALMKSYPDIVNPRCIDLVQLVQEHVGGLLCDVDASLVDATQS